MPLSRSCFPGLQRVHNITDLPKPRCNARGTIARADNDCLSGLADDTGASSAPKGNALYFLAYRRSDVILAQIHPIDRKNAANGVGRQTGPRQRRLGVAAGDTRPLFARAAARQSGRQLARNRRRQRAWRLRSAVLDFGGQRVVVIGVPWYLTEPKIEEGMTEEEAAEPFRVQNVLGFHLRRSRRMPP